MRYSPNWYWNRLRAMSPVEMALRGVHAVHTWRWRRRKDWPLPSPHLAFCAMGASAYGGSDSWVLPGLDRVDEEQKAALRAAADRTLSGAYRMLNIEFSEPDLDWHLDPQTGVRAPMDYSLDINYRDPSVAGNVKNIWEKNRHHHVSVLAAAYAATRDERYAAETARQLTSWVRNNPFLRGVNWTSALELGIRLIAWTWMERLLRGAPQHHALFGADGVMWPVIYRHQWLIRHYYSVGSSANNHLIGELAGLFIASTVWPYFPESRAWGAYAREKLEEAMVRQTFPDGLNREQAFAYHVFVLDFFLLVAAEAARAGAPISRTGEVVMAKMARAIVALTDCRGHVPRYGDDDEGKALDLGPIRSALDCPWWKDCLSRLPAPENEYAFSGAGLYVLAQDRGTPNERLCIMDAGPLGYLSIAAHGHADALAFTLNVGGEPVIVDPGTGAYHADPAARAYFRSTRAHNTVTVDGLDQSQPAGVFLWTHHARTRILEWGSGRIEAEHDGYRRLSDPVTHRRVAQWVDDALVIADELDAQGEHEYEFRLHFSPRCRVAVGDEEFVVQWDGGQMRISRDAALTYRVAEGEDEAGWYSPGFNVKERAPTLIGTVRAKGHARFVHAIRV